MLFAVWNMTEKVLAVYKLNLDCIKEWNKYDIVDI